MDAPKEIVQCVRLYEELKEKMEAIAQEMDLCRAIVSEWEGKGLCINELYIASKPSGDVISQDGEYCHQHCLGDARYVGVCYHPIKGGNEYVAYSYESSMPIEFGKV